MLGKFNKIVMLKPQSGSSIGGALLLEIIRYFNSCYFVRSVYCTLPTDHLESNDQSGECE